MAKSFPNTGATVGLAADRSALTSPFAGQQFFETDTKALYLYNGSAWVSMLDTDTPPGLVFIASQSISGSATFLAFDNVFDSTKYEFYHLVMRVSSSSDAHVWARFRNSSGDIAGNVYEHMRYAFDDVSVGGLTYGTNTEGYMTYFTTVGNTDGNRHMSGFDVYPHSYYKRMSGTYNGNRNGGRPTTGYFGVACGDGTTATGIKIAVGAGNLYGKISIYGYSN